MFPIFQLLFDSFPAMELQNIILHWFVDAQILNFVHAMHDKALMQNNFL